MYEGGKCILLDRILPVPVHRSFNLASTGESVSVLTTMQAPAESSTLILKEGKVDLFLLAFFNMVFVGFFFFCCPVYEWIWSSHVQATNRSTDADDWIWHRELLIKIPIHFLVADIFLL
jgi:hypothetical protein